MFYNNMSGVNALQLYVKCLCRIMVRQVRMPYIGTSGVNALKWYIRCEALYPYVRSECATMVGHVCMSYNRNQN